MANNASKTRADEIAYVDAAILAYCPRYMRLTGTLTSLSSQPDKARHPIGWRADLSGPSVLLDDAVRDRARRPLDTQRLAAREGFGLKREERSLRLVVAEFLLSTWNCTACPSCFITSDQPVLHFFDRCGNHVVVCGVKIRRCHPCNATRDVRQHPSEPDLIEVQKRRLAVAAEIPLSLSP